MLSRMMDLAQQAAVALLSAQLLNILSAIMSLQAVLDAHESVEVYSDRCVGKQWHHPEATCALSLLDQGP